MKKHLILAIETLFLLVNRLAMRGLMWCEEHYPIPDDNDEWHIGIGIESARRENVVHIPRTQK